MALKIKIESFEGPLDLLLQLVVGQELAISEVSLSNVADQYLEYLHSVEEKNADELADFLVVAAKLLLLKSRELLPGLPAAPDEGPSLEVQLKMYKLFHEASLRLNEVLAKKHYIFFRDKLPVAITPRFAPPPSVTSGRLHAVMLEVLTKVTPVITYPEERVKKTVSIQEKIKHIRDFVHRAQTVRFRDLMQDASSKTEVVVHFLALLELIKARDISVDQSEPFGEITIKRNEEQQHSHE